MEGLLEVPVGVSKPRHKGQFVPFGIATRFVIDLLEFHPDGNGYSVAKWSPQHLLQVPSPKVLADIHPFEEIHFSDNEQPFLSREDAIPTIAAWNRDTLAKVAANEDKKFCWFFGVELGFRSVRDIFASINHTEREIDVLRMRFRYLKPTAAELAQYGKAVQA